ncbi:A24 family peptidase [Trinickia sp. Y13]|uniref:A24 family peptidase n=1 Tax=Trinickia sp. Y13 TaxID=2917807 RepID=UPI002405A9F2|nr:A24 family peptidase [Trinickia sp. Y13]MDG0022843.1 A24 family peptidase [Trinickia sp. Y13]
MSMTFASALFIAWAATVVGCDLRNRRVPNRLVMAGVTVALACAALHASPFAIVITQAAYGAVAGCFVLLPFFLLGVMGAADVKVFAVLGAWCGVSALLDLWVMASIAAGVHAFALIAAARARSRATWAPARSRWRSAQPTFAVAGRRATPYAALLCCAAMAHWLGAVARGAAT